MAVRNRKDEVFPDAAGIDVGASSHWIAVPQRNARLRIRPSTRIIRAAMRNGIGHAGGHRFKPFKAVIG